MHLPRHFHLAVDSLGLRRGASWSQIIDQPQNFPEQVPRHRHLGQLERDVPPVAHHFQPGIEEQHAQSRAFVRVPLALNVSFESRGEVRECLMKNLSAGGIFVATESPLPIGTPFNVRIRIERTGEEIELPGEVVSVGASADLADDEHGMGIRFVNLDEAQREQVAELSEQAMKKAIEGA